MLIFLRARQPGDLPQALPAATLGAMFAAMAYQSLREWACDEGADLPRRRGPASRACSPGPAR